MSGIRVGLQIDYEISYDVDELICFSLMTLIDTDIDICRVK